KSDLPYLAHIADRTGQHLATPPSLPQRRIDTLQLSAMPTQRHRQSGANRLAPGDIDQPRQPSQQPPCLFFHPCAHPRGLKEECRQAHFPPSPPFGWVPAYRVVAGDHHPVAFRPQLAHPRDVAWVLLGVPLARMLERMSQEDQHFPRCAGKVGRLGTIEIEPHAASRAPTSYRIAASTASTG